jgi:hypothetical protein
MIASMGQKFFINFNSADGTKAHWIAWTLKEAGHEVAVHDWEIPAGGNVPLWMNTKLAWADRLIAVISPDYVPSRYSPMEWASQIWNNPGGTKGSVIPVIVRPTSKMPSLLEGLSRIDLTNCSEDDARLRLIKGVDMPAPPELKPAFEKIEGEPPDSQHAGPAEKPTFVRVTELERPFLGVEVLQSGLKFTETGTVTSISEFKYQFINYGRTAARLTELVETWPVVKRINEKEDGGRYSYTSILPDPIDPTKQRGRTLPYGVVVSNRAAPAPLLRHLISATSAPPVCVGATETFVTDRRGRARGAARTQLPYRRGRQRLVPWCVPRHNLSPKKGQISGVARQRKGGTTRHLCGRTVNPTVAACD